MTSAGQGLPLAVDSSIRAEEWCADQTTVASSSSGGARPASSRCVGRRATGRPAPRAECRRRRPTVTTPTTWNESDTRSPRAGPMTSIAWRDQRSIPSRDWRRESPVLPPSGRTSGWSLPRRSICRRAGPRKATFDLHVTGRSRPPHRPHAAPRTRRVESLYDCTARTALSRRHVTGKAQGTHRGDRLEGALESGPSTP